MKVTTILFIMLSFTLTEVLILQETSQGVQVEFPELGVPGFEFKDPRSCESFGSCVGYVGDIVFNIGLGIVNTVLFVFGLSKFILEIFGLIIFLSITGIEGAPFYVNLLLTAPLTLGTGLLIYKLLRSGRSKT